METERLNPDGTTMQDTGSGGTPRLGDHLSIGVISREKSGGYQLIPPSLEGGMPGVFGGQQARRTMIMKRIMLVLLVVGLAMMSFLVPMWMRQQGKMEEAGRMRLEPLRPRIGGRVVAPCTQVLTGALGTADSDEGMGLPPFSLKFDRLSLDADTYSLLDLDVRHGTLGTLRILPNPDLDAEDILLDLEILSKSQRQLDRVLVQKALIFDLFRNTMEMHLFVDGPHRGLMTDGPVDVRMTVHVPLKKTVMGFRFFGEMLNVLIEGDKIMKFGELIIGTGTGRITAKDESLLMAKNMEMYTTKGDIELFGLAYRDSVQIETELGDIRVPALFPHRKQATDYTPWSVQAHTASGSIHLRTAVLDGVEFSLKSATAKAVLDLPDPSLDRKVKLSENQDQLKAGVFGLGKEGTVEGYVDLQSTGVAEWKVDAQVKVVSEEDLERYM